MIASTSRGAGTTTVPSPHRLLIVGPIGTTFGKPLLWSSFSLQEDRVFVARLLIALSNPLIQGFEVSIRNDLAA
jgi:hypothetical protein